MNMYNRLPHFVYINNEKYFINTDFRIFIDLEIEMQGKSKKQATIKCLSRFYPAFSKIKQNNIKEAVDQFIWFYRCGKNDEVLSNNNKETKDNTRLYDYNIDSDIIWGAYKEQYNVELDTINLHWWKFKAMWNSLSKDCQFNKVRGYRAYNGDDKDLLELKKLYELPKTEDELNDQARRNKIFEELNKMAS